MVVVPLLALVMSMLLIPGHAEAQQTFSTFQAANLVVGQPNFTSSGIALTATGLVRPSCVAISSKGIMAVANQLEGTITGRVLLYNTITTNGQAAFCVLGQPDFGSSATGTTASTIGSSNGLAFSPDGNKLIVTDRLRHRVLIWNSIPTVNNTPADVVVGQVDFTSNGAATAQNRFNNPNGVFVSADGRLFVVDGFNHRVMIWNSIPTTNGAPADVVLGQPNFTSSAPATSATGMNSPWGVWVARTGELLVADFENNRVLVWNSVPTTNGAPANRVIGQPNFTSNGPATSASGMYGPQGVSVSPAGELAVGEFYNHRVLLYNSIPASNGASANVVLGQPNFTSNTIHTPGGTPTSQNMYEAYNVAYDLYGRIFAVSRFGRRVLVYGTLPAQTANLELSMTAGSTASCGSTPTTLTVTVSNTGPNNATGVRVNASLPYGFSLGSASATTGIYIAAGGSWTIGTIPAGGSAVLTLNGTTGSGGQYTASAGITASNQLDTDLTNNAGSITYDITPGSCITTGAFANPVCADGSSVYALPYTTTGTFTGGNVFTAQLSDASGNFASPTVIGSLVSTGSGSINCTMPIATPAGSGYRVRVVSTAPVVTGFNNGSDITIDAADSWYADADGDGYGNPNVSTLACTQPTGYVANNTDCDDNDAAINPAATEVCDGIDNNCSGLIDDADPAITGQSTWYADADGDGYGDANVSTLACTQPTGYVANNTDCDDNDAAINPAATEVCDGIDNNCSGLIDDADPAITGQSTWYADADGDGYGDANVSTLACTQPTGYVANNTDCDDNDAAINPAATEVCDGIDNNCSGLIDDADPAITGQSTWYADADGDGYGDANVSTLACTQPTGYVANNTDCDDSDAAINPGATEVCDGIDNNCSGLIDDADPAITGQSTWYADADGDGYGDANVSTLACTQPTGYVANNTDCDDNDAAINPGATEVCDGIDNNCSGLIDDADPAITGQSTWYADQDGDGLGDPNTVLLACTQPAGYVDNADDDCPLNPLPIGSACDDGNFTTLLDVVGADCICAGLPCTELVTLEINTDFQGQQTTWEVIDDVTGITIIGGGPYFPGFQINVVSTFCVPVGCYLFRVYDLAGDGMVAGFNGGYQLRDALDNRRIIDNKGNGAFGSISGITGNGYSFCMPLGDVEPIYTSCDKYWWRTGEFLVATPDDDVSAEWIVGAPGNQQSTTSGYEFWFYNPNGGYSFRRFRNHRTGDGFGPANEVRACHMKVNNWAVANHIPEFDLMNVRIRPVVSGLPGPWGPACRFVRDESLGLCPPTKLMDIPGNQFLSCGQFRQFVSNQRIHSRPVAQANQYQWRFRIPAENTEIIRTSNSYFLNLGWGIGVAAPLMPGKTYEVDVRAFRNGAWCIDPLDPDSAWGDICLLTIQNTPAQGQDQSIARGAPERNVRMWPNPNRGDQLWISSFAALGGTVEVETIAVDIHDLSGKRVMAREIPVQDNDQGTVIDLEGQLANGMYLVSITVGNERHTQRLVIAQ
jgi:uncharacterized repeat protein (TIGR01451 family)